MTRRLLPCLCLLVFCASASFAQSRDYPKVDFTAAFTLNSLDTTPSRQKLYGFTGAIGGNFKKWFAIEGDVTYTTKTITGTSVNLLTYVVGPRFTKRSSNSKLQPFVHALFGGGHLNGVGTGVNASTNGWAGKMGGGLDIVAGKHVAIRVVQIDYYRYHGNVTVGTQRLNNAAFTFGLRIF